MSRACEVTTAPHIKRKKKMFRSEKYAKELFLDPEQDIYFLFGDEELPKLDRLMFIDFETVECMYERGFKHGLEAALAYLKQDPKTITQMAIDGIFYVQD